MKKAVFLDRDGTINIDKDYLYQKEAFEFLPGVIEALKLLQTAGYLLFIITNQSGIARGYYTEEQFQELNHWMIQCLEKENIVITDVYYCPHLPNAKIAQYRKDCSCRKPALGLFQKAINTYDIDVEHSYAIGDKMRDCEICKQSLCRGFLIGRGESDQVIDQVKAGLIKRISYERDLLSCAKQIWRENDHREEIPN